MSLFNLTKKADYALVLMGLLAKVGKGTIVSVNQVAKKRDLPRAFMAQIAKELVEKGFLGSKEGRGGGYYLLSDPGEIGVKGILNAIEGKVALATCMIAGRRCDHYDNCGQKRFMGDLGKRLEGVLTGVTVADLTNF